MDKSFKDSLLTAFFKDKEPIIQSNRNIDITEHLREGCLMGKELLILEKKEP